jgi:hypothetical protein
MYNSHIFLLHITLCFLAILESYNFVGLADDMLEFVGSRGLVTFLNFLPFLILVFYSNIVSKYIFY